jgi:hypothetical protein
MNGMCAPVPCDLSNMGIRLDAITPDSRLSDFFGGVFLLL